MKIGGNIYKCVTMGNNARLRIKINKIEKKAANICIHMGLHSAAGENFCKLYVCVCVCVCIYIYIYIYIYI